VRKQDLDFYIWIFVNWSKQPTNRQPFKAIQARIGMKPWRALLMALKMQIKVSAT
jgi:hypothetical protein